MKTFDEYYEVAKGIIVGDYDDYLDQIGNSIKTRRDALAPKIWDFSVGDRVRFNNKTGPKYLIGAVGTVTQVNRVKVVVDLDERRRRFFKNISVPLLMIEKV
jgi:hypothetical protein